MSGLNFHWHFQYPIIPIAWLVESVSYSSYSCNPNALFQPNQETGAGLAWRDDVAEDEDEEDKYLYGHVSKP